MKIKRVNQWGKTAVRFARTVNLFKAGYLVRKGMSLLAECPSVSLRSRSLLSQ